MLNESNKIVNLDFRKVGIGSIIYILGDILTRGISFLLIPLYTRYLDPIEYGNLGVLLSLVSLLSILLPLQLGSALTVNYFQIDTEKRRDLISTVWFVALFSSVIMAFFFINEQAWVSIVFTDITRSNYYLVVGISFFASFALIPQTLMRLRQNVIMMVSLNTFFYVCSVVFGVILLIWFHLGVTGLLLGMLIANVCSVIPYILTMRNDLIWAFSNDFFRKSILIAFPIVPHMLSHWGLNLMDRVILQSHVPLSDVGIYQLGYQLGTICQILVIAINNAWAPFFLENFNHVDKVQSIRKIASWLVFVQIWIALFLVLFIPELLHLFISKEYRGAEAVIPWVVLGFTFVGFYHYWINILLFYKKTGLVFIATGVSALFNLVLNLLLIPRFGFLAAAVNTAICYAFLASLSWLFAKRISEFSYEYSRWAKVALVGLVLFIIEAGFLPFRLSFFVKLCIITFFPFYLFFVSFWTQGEIDLFRFWFAKSLSYIRSLR